MRHLHCHRPVLFLDTRKVRIEEASLPSFSLSLHLYWVCVFYRSPSPINTLVLYFISTGSLSAILHAISLITVGTKLTLTSACFYALLDSMRQWDKRTPYTLAFTSLFPNVSATPNFVNKTLTDDRFSHSLIWMVVYTNALLATLNARESLRNRAAKPLSLPNLSTTGQMISTVLPTPNDHPVLLSGPTTPSYFGSISRGHSFLSIVSVCLFRIFAILFYMLLISCSGRSGFYTVDAQLRDSRIRCAARYDHFCYPFWMQASREVRGLNDSEGALLQLLTFYVYHAYSIFWFSSVFADQNNVD